MFFCAIHLESSNVQITYSVDNIASASDVPQLPEEPQNILPPASGTVSPLPIDPRPQPDHARTGEDVPPPPSDLNALPPTIEGVPQPERVPHPLSIPVPSQLVRHPSQPERYSCPQPERIPSPHPQPVPAQFKSVSTSHAEGEPVSSNVDVPMDDAHISAPGTSRALGANTRDGNEIDRDLSNKLRAGTEESPAEPPLSSTQDVTGPMDVDAPNPPVNETTLKEAQKGPTRKPIVVERVIDTTTHPMEVDSDEEDDAEGDVDSEPTQDKNKVVPRTRSSSSHKSDTHVSTTSARVRPTDREYPLKSQRIVVEPHPEIDPEPASTTNIHTPVEIRRSARIPKHKVVVEGHSMPASKRKRSQKSSKMIESDDESDDDDNDNEIESDDDENNTQLNNQDEKTSTSVLNDWKQVQHVFVCLF